MKNDILMPGEIVVRESTASRININDYAATGGNLILTNLRIIYVITKHTEIDCVIPLSDVARKGDKFDIYSNTPNVVKIRTKNGMFYEFSVRKGDKSLWENDIEKSIGEYMEKHFSEETEEELEEIIEELEEVVDEQEIIEESKDKTSQKQDAAPQKMTFVQNTTRMKSLAVMAVVAFPIVGLFFEHGFWLFLLMGIGFCYWDESILHHSGYDTLNFTKTYLIPVYLFQRARMLKSGMEYFILWIFTFIIGVIGTFTSLSFWIKLFEAIQTMATNTPTIQ